MKTHQYVLITGYLTTATINEALLLDCLLLICSLDVDANCSYIFKLKKLIANRESIYGDAKFIFYNPT